MEKFLGKNHSAHALSSQGRYISDPRENFSAGLRSPPLRQEGCLPLQQTTKLLAISFLEIAINGSELSLKRIASRRVFSKTVGL